MSPGKTIVHVDSRWQRQHEQMGSKAKFWCRADDDRKWLFKRCRDGTGEDWAEKVAAEVAAVLGIPHAHVELAESDGNRGCVVLDFVGEQAALIHGNELLWELDNSYPREQRWRVTGHTIDNVLRVLSMPKIMPPEGSSITGMDAVDVFIGYLLLDTLIGNSDRHHENWALLRLDNRVTLAPTYDHASSLGRELRDDARHDILRRGIDNYARKARSALYATLADHRPLSPRAAFLTAAATRPRAHAEWLARLAGLSEAALRQIIEKVHPERISPEATAFAIALMGHNQRLLLEIETR